MTYQEELDALSATYSAWLAAGCPQSYTTGSGGASRSVTRAQAEWMSKRIDQLRLAVARQSQGMVSVAQFRPTE